MYDIINIFLYASTSNTPHIGEQQMNRRIANHNQMPQSRITQPTHQVTVAEIEAMGGKVNTHSAHHHNKSYSQPSNRTTKLPRQMMTLAMVNPCY